MEDAGKKKPEETDIIELLAKGVLAIRNNFKPLLTAFLIGTALGVAFYLVVPKRYSSRMIIQSSILTEAYSASLTKDLGQLLNEKNTLEVSKKLGLTEKEASLIYSIDIASINEKKDKLEGKELANAFLVTAQVFDNTVLTKLQVGILSFLSSNEYVKIREKQHRDYFKGMIAKVDMELLSLDSMKQNLFSRKAKSFDVLLMDPTNIYRMAVELNKEKIGYQNGLELVNSVQLVEGFTAYNKASFPKLSFSLTGGALLGVIIISIVLGYKALLSVVEFSKRKLEQF